MAAPDLIGRREHCNLFALSLIGDVTRTLLHLVLATAGLRPAGVLRFDSLLRAGLAALPGIPDREPQWREVFTHTWRHHYVPSFYPDLTAPCLLSIDPQRRSEWLAAVYSDQTLITKVVQVPLSPAL